MATCCVHVQLGFTIIHYKTYDVSVVLVREYAVENYETFYVVYPFQYTFGAGDQVTGTSLLERSIYPRNLGPSIPISLQLGPHLYRF